MAGEADGLADLAALLGVPVDVARVALGEPWSPGDRGSTLWGEFTIFTGRENPRNPDRPLIAIVVDHTEETVELGHAVGVPLPDGRMRWSLGAPRTSIPLDPADLREWAADHASVPSSLGDEALRSALLEELRLGIERVADTAMLRGAEW